MAVAAVAALLVQAGPMWGPTPGPVAEARYLRYERAIAVPHGAGGEVCAVLDAAVFAHAASRSGDDLRVFREVAGGVPVEVPFALTESEAAPGEAESAKVVRAKVKDGRVSFDLAMPGRAYSAVELQLAAKNFVGIATVEGSDGRGGKATPMGFFAVFDLSAKRLGRSTELALQESRFAELHVDLQMWKPERGVFEGLSAGMVEGATVPPSRGAQTLYTTVATAEGVTQEGGWSVVRVHVPAHVPVERVTVDLAPGLQKDFLREVRIEARPDNARDAGEVERVGGEISRVQLPLYMDANVGATLFRRLSVEAALAANLRSAAMVEVGIDGGEAPLPVQAVRLEMRQRMVCFGAMAGAAYTLRYGDGGLRAPVYTEERAGARPLVATIGEERLRSGFVARSEVRGDRERQPGLPWIGLLAGVTVLSAMAMQRVKRKGRR